MLNSNNKNIGFNAVTDSANLTNKPDLNNMLITNGTATLIKALDTEIGTPKVQNLSNTTTEDDDSDTSPDPVAAEVPYTVENKSKYQAKLEYNKKLIWAIENQLSTAADKGENLRTPELDKELQDLYNQNECIDKWISNGEANGGTIYDPQYTYKNRDGNTVTNNWTISNKEFLNSDSLTQQQITDICNSHNPGLVELGYDKAIYELCKSKGINPKVILATLGQEQSWCKNGNYNSAFGVGPEGHPISYAGVDMGGVADAVDTFLYWYNYALELEKKGKLGTLFVNQDSDLSGTRAIFGGGTDSWLNSHPNYRKLLEDGQNITPANAAMYAKLKYTPWVDFPPQNSHPLDDWLNIYNSL